MQEQTINIQSEFLECYKKSKGEGGSSSFSSATGSCEEEGISPGRLERREKREQEMHEVACSHFVVV